MLIRLIGVIGAAVIRAWIGTMSFRFLHLGPVLDPARLPEDATRNLYVIWHENLLVPCNEFGGLGIKVLISQHQDGEIIAQICKHLGFGTIRGSSTRGGMKAMREMLRTADKSHITVLPDGPRGPRRRLEKGLVYLAAKSGMPIVLVGVGHDRPWRLNSWDRFVIPKPFTTALLVSAPAILIPPDVNSEQLEAYRIELETKLSELTDYAERLAMR